jgi:hypothetical protein
MVQLFFTPVAVQDFDPAEILIPVIGAPPVFDGYVKVTFKLDLLPLFLDAIFVTVGALGFEVPAWDGVVMSTPIESAPAIARESDLDVFMESPRWCDMTTPRYHLLTLIWVFVGMTAEVKGLTRTPRGTLTSDK